MREPMTNVEVDRMKQEIAYLTWPHGRMEPRVDYVLSATQLDRLIESIRELHRQKRELHDRLHRLSSRNSNA